MGELLRTNETAAEARKRSGSGQHLREADGSFSREQLKRRSSISAVVRRWSQSLLLLLLLPPQLQHRKFADGPLENVAMAGYTAGRPKFTPRQLRRLIGIVAVFVSSVMVLDQLGVFLKIGEDHSRDPGYEYPLRGDQFDDFLPVNHRYDSLEFRIHNNSACKERLRVAIFVKSALPHRSRRNIIRRTWGKQRFSNVAMKTFFMIGQGAEDSDLIVENEKHGDIIQVGFVDNYYNNTLKTMSSLRWATQYCRNTQYFLLIDDDYYLSMKNLLRYIAVFEAESGGSLFAGTLFASSPPMRHRFSRWFVSLRDYPYSRYPAYITAGAMLFNADAAQKIYGASKFTKHFVFDDVFLGICARKARVTPKHSDFFQMWKPAEMSDMIAVHGFADSSLEREWNANYRKGFA